MANIDKTMTELENLFRSFTVSVIGGSPAIDVRIDWPEDGAPAWKINEDIIFLKVAEKSDGINRQKDEKIIASVGNTVTRSIEYIRVIEVSWIVYGPSSYENSQLIRESFYLDELREILSKQNISLIPDDKAPLRVPELFQGRWWKRWDYSASFNEKIRKETMINTIGSAEIEIHDYSGEVAKIEVEES